MDTILVLGGGWGGVNEIANYLLGSSRCRRLQEFEASGALTLRDTVPSYPLRCLFMELPFVIEH